MIETERLILREYCLEDFEAIFEILSDAETMQHYPKPYDEEMTWHWIEWNIQNYNEHGFGLWAVVPDEKNEISYAYTITRKEWDAICHESKLKSGFE